MLWVWIIVAIIIIALIIWFLMRGRGSKGAADSQVGRHASAEGGTDNRSTGTGTNKAGAAAAGVAGAAAGRDRDRADSSAATGSTTDSSSTADDGAKPDATGAGAHAAPTSAVPLADRDQQAGAGGAMRSADVPEGKHGAKSSDDAAGDAHDAPTAAMPVAGQPQTGANDDSALPADGSDEFDDVHDAVDTAHSPTGETGPGSDAQVAEKNDEVTPRRADAPTQAPAEATRHSDNEIQGTDVQHPTAGIITPEGAEGATGVSGAGDDAAQHVWSDGHDPDRAKGNLGDPSVDEPDSKAPTADDKSATAAAPVVGTDTPVEPASDKAATGDAQTVGAGQSVGYSVDSAAGGTTADASAQGEDPMTERFGNGAASTKPDGSAPAGHPIKGNADSMLFHTEDSPRYAATQPEVWFRDEAAATAAGFAHWDREKRGKAPAGSAAGSDSGSIAGSDSSSGSAGTSYTIGTSHPGHAVTGLTGRSDSELTDSASGSHATPSDPMQAQFGPGAASPREDGSAPSDGHKIKGNADSMLFHTEDSPHYARTEAEVWFTDEEAAKKAGFKHWDHRKR